MKSYLLSIAFLSFSVLTCAQVQIRPLPERGYEERIIQFIQDMPVVDTHEHLLSPPKLKQRTSLDFMVLLDHYSSSDIKSAGMPGRTFQMLLKDSLSPTEKWRILQPYWEGASNTAYIRTAILSADKLFNVKDINESTVTVLSEKIRKAYKTDWINQIIEKAKIDILIQDDLDNDDRSFANERYRYVKRFDDFVSINSKVNITNLAKKHNITISSLDDLVMTLESAFRTTKEQGVIGVKTALAYTRILYHESVNKVTAEDVFKKVNNTRSEESLSFAEVKPLQDYMMRRILDMAGKYDIPVAVHTGLQSGNGNIIENSNPTHLVNLFGDYPEVKFVLYHGGYPFGGEVSTIVKYYRNVYLDMCWLYVISPSFSERYLHEWLETVPASKIMGFGGDYRNVENVYGHLLLAKQIIANVLIDKVKDGYFSESEAKDIARMILHDNAMKFYKLKQS